MKHLGLKLTGGGQATVKQKVEDFNIDYSHFNSQGWAKGLVKPVEFARNGKGNHKQTLINEYGHCCMKCKNSVWNGLPITLELEHIDGDNSNNEKENLSLLCPNCHSQTPTWRRSKNKTGRQKYTDDQILEAVKSSKSMQQTLDKLNLAWGSYVTVLSVMKKYKIDLSIWGS